MISRAMVKNRAMMMGVLDGDMPEVEFIWEMQRSEGGWECFGQGVRCTKKDCRWRKECLALENYSEIRLSPSTAEIDAVFDDCLRRDRNYSNPPSLDVDLSRQEHLSRFPQS